MSHNSILIWTSAHRASVLSICTVLCRRDLRPLPCLGQGCGTLGTVQSCQPPRVLGGNSRGSRTGRSGGAGSDPNSATSFNNHSEICFTLENTFSKVLPMQAKSPGKKTHLQISPNAKLNIFIMISVSHSSCSCQ